jgi:hypothetical protein
MYAKHSIHYKNLESYVYGICVINNNHILNWSKTLEIFKDLGIPPVETLYEGIYNEDLIKTLYKETYNGNEMEGYVVRLYDSFNEKDFSTSVAKFVRKHHVKEDEEHWFSRTSGEINQLKHT